MTLPLPIDPDFRKECVGFWLDDVEDRLEEAERSWKEANSLYLSLPPGYGNLTLEDRLVQLRVKLDKLTNS